MTTDLGPLPDGIAFGPFGPVYGASQMIAERARTYALGIEHGRAQAARIVREAAAHGLCCSDCDALADLIERARDVNEGV